MEKSFIISEPDCFTSLCYCCRVAASVLCFFITAPVIGLWYVNV